MANLKYSKGLSLQNYVIEAAVFIFLHIALCSAMRRFNQQNNSKQVQKKALDYFKDKISDWLAPPLKKSYEITTTANKEWSEVWKYVRTRIDICLAPSQDDYIIQFANILFDEIDNLVGKDRNKEVTLQIVESEARDLLQSQMAEATDIGDSLFWGNCRDENYATEKKSRAMLFIRKEDNSIRERGFFGLGISGRVFSEESEQIKKYNFDNEESIKKCILSKNNAVVIFWTPNEQLNKKYSKTKKQRVLNDFFLFEFGLSHEIACHASAPDDRKAEVASGTEKHGMVTYLQLAYFFENLRNCEDILSQSRTKLLQKLLSENDEKNLNKWFGLATNGKNQPDYLGWKQSQECAKKPVNIVNGGILYPQRFDLMLMCARFRLMSAESMENGQIDNWMRLKDYKKIAACLLKCIEECPHCREDERFFPYDTSALEEILQKNSQHYMPNIVSLKPMIQANI